MKFLNISLIIRVSACKNLDLSTTINLTRQRILHLHREILRENLTAKNDNSHEKPVV